MPATEPGSVLVTGGAGFIGGSVCVRLAERFPKARITALDNLHRSGSELNLPRLQEAGVTFVQGDVREPDDLIALEPHEAIVECSAEPSVLAGMSDTAYAFHSNLVGAYNCVELARRDGSHFVFLSTSRVYPVAALSSLALDETETRFEIADEQEVPGASAKGISERFGLEGARTLYGTTKLAAELVIAEYVADQGLRAVIDRCGVVAGPWQMGKVDQGVFTHWVVSHYFKRPLTYIGHGGQGKQVRDLLHVEDLVELVTMQLGNPELWNGKTFNVGGGRPVSLSLREATASCEDLTGRTLEISSELENRPGDVPVYISDCSALESFCDWRPARGPREILQDILAWISDNERSLEAVLC